MFNTNSQTEYLQRAEMHDKLAAATADPLARKMHLAMAAEYRRRAAECDPISIVPSSDTDPVLKLNVAVR